MTIEQLLEVEVTSTASKFSQEVTRAPASVTVVTADEIKTHGIWNARGDPEQRARALHLLRSQLHLRGRARVRSAG